MTAALMVGCSGGEGPGPGAPSDNPGGGSLPDPCTLVTAAEVETAIGAPVGEGISELVSNPTTGEGRSCRFEAADGRAEAMVEVWPNPGELFEAYKEHQNGFGGIEDVPGLGDDAFTVGNTQVEVLKGDVLIVIGIAPISLANDPKPLVIALGSAAAGRV
jgi:hypothetical protein